MGVKSLKAVVNGQAYTLTLNSSTGKWEATITAPSKSSYTNNDSHYYPVSITADDTAGNTRTINDTDATLGASLKLKVTEKVAPVITINSPSDGAQIANSKPTITWTVTDDDSGVNSGTIGITIDSGSKITSGITKTPITGGYSCSYTPATALTDGLHTIKFSASDNDGNAATQKTVTFKVDTVPPVLDVTAPVDGFTTNNKTISFSGTTNDATSNTVDLVYKVNGGSAVSVTVGSGGAFSGQITLPDTDGTYAIEFIATDGAGKTTTVTRNVTLDTVAPIFRAITITPNPVDAGATFIISVEVED